MKLRLDLNTYESCPTFKLWLDEEHFEESGELFVLGFRPRPSFVLYSLSQDTYQALFSDFQRQRQDKLLQSFFDDFPSPIAHYFYRFQKGYESDLQRLHFLRDTWEAIVDILHAMTVAECRFRNLSLIEP